MIRSSLEEVIACLETEVKQMDQEIRALLQTQTDLQAQEKLLRTAKSIDWTGDRGHPAGRAA